MNNSQIIQKVLEFVRQEMEGLCAAHDFLHIERVVKNARKIWEAEGQRGNIHVIEISSYLHEALDEKFFLLEGMQERNKLIRNLLKSIEVSEQDVQSIMFIIEHIGFGKSLERPADFSAPAEFYIVEDADRLESIGVIAIARCFSYGGKKGRPIYDPTISPEILTNKENYQIVSNQSNSLNHFYEKLFLLRDMMHTETGKKLAGPRHDFMQYYVEQFLKEWRE